MANVTYPSIQDEELSLSTLLAGVIALLVVAIAVVCSLIAIVWFLRLKHSRSLQISTNLNIRFSSYNRNIVSQGAPGRVEAPSVRIQLSRTKHRIVCVQAAAFIILDVSFLVSLVQFFKVLETNCAAMRV